ncbi:MAG TPA: NADH-quinone oxidoreductase subunit C [Vicinamibacterales bacterium]|nr:NADH-quinone oxidoreductase subunit C [Vicinamibacterales bacterium]
MSTYATPPLSEHLPPGSFEVIPSGDGMPTIVVPADRLVEVCRILRDSPALRFVVCLDVTAVDHGPREPRFDVVYHFTSPEQRLRLRVHVYADGADPRVPTICDIWPSANWQEREVYDLFGIVFEGHPDLRRLLMPDDWEGHPLRKDYPVQVNLPVKTYEPVQLTEEQFRENIAADRARRGR